MAAFYRMQPLVTRIRKVQSGGYNDNWVEAHFNITKQMNIMRGKLTDDKIRTNRHGVSSQSYISKLVIYIKLDLICIANYKI